MLRRRGLVLIGIGFVSILLLAICLRARSAGRAERPVSAEPPRPEPSSSPRTEKRPEPASPRVPYRTDLPRVPINVEETPRAGPEKLAQALRASIEERDGTRRAAVVRALKQLGPPAIEAVELEMNRAPDPVVRSALRDVVNQLK